MIDFEMLKEFGFPISMVIIMIMGFSWFGKVMITFFINTIKDQNDERQRTNKTFMEVMSGFQGQLEENTKILKVIHDRMSHGESRSDHI